MRHSTIRQKSLILGVFIRLCQDPQALVELYINYDCDRASLENVYEKLMNIVSKIGQTHFAPPSKEELSQQQGSSSKQDSHRSGGPAIPPSLSTAALVPESNKEAYAGLPPEIKLRRQSLECLVAALKSLVMWSTSTSTRQAGTADDAGAASASRVSMSEDGQGAGQGLGLGLGRQLAASQAGSNTDLSAPTPTPTWPEPGSSRANTNGLNTPVPDAEGDDDVGRFESAKQRKTNLIDGIKKFNFKPKRGIAFLLEQGFIRSRAPQDIARFLLGNEGLSKAMIGEYLGEG